MATAISSLRLLAGIALSFCALESAQSQQLPRSYIASPDIYKVLAQNDQYRVIAVTWKSGQKDILHSHPANAVYYLTDCSLHIYAQDGTSRDGQPKAGTAIVQREIAGHVLENVGPTECRLVMFEPS